MTLEIREFCPEDAVWIATRHAALYRDAEGFDDSFEPLVRQTLAEFVQGHDPDCERGWVAWQDDARVGCIFCVRLTQEVAKLRMFLLEPEIRGSGLGRQLLETCMGFAKACGYREMTLWTHESHVAACRLYARNGFTCTASKPVHSFGQNLIEQTWTRVL